MTANIQLSGKTQDGRIFVVGGNDADDFLLNLSSVLGGPELAAEAMEDAARTLVPLTAGGATAPAQGFPVPPSITAAFPQATPVAESNAAAPSCHHGPKVFRNGVSAKTGKAWSSWMCPSPKGTPDQCPAQWV